MACVHRLEGCTYTSQRQLLATHLKDECSYSQVACTHNGCEEMLKRSELPRHIQETHRNASEEEEASPITQKSTTSDNDDKVSSGSSCFCLVLMTLLSRRTNAHMPFMDVLTTGPWYPQTIFLHVLTKLLKTSSPPTLHVYRCSRNRISCYDIVWKAWKERCRV